MHRSIQWGARASVVGLFWVLLAVVAPPAAVAASFQPVGNLTRARSFPTATALLDGTVLVTGGLGLEQDQFAILPHAERFDPKTNTFKAVAGMNQGRWFHTAVRLQDGQVLVLGGTADGQVSLGTAEVFDPASGNFTRVGEMFSLRERATATLLTDGRVLVVGGFDSGAGRPLATAEIWDPNSGEFSPTGTLASPRGNHAAVLLPSGQVAILGGIDDQGLPIRRVEIYDPASGSFTPKGEISERSRPTGTVLPDGKVLVAGGRRLDPRFGGFFVDRNSVEIYDPATGQSKISGSLAAARYDHLALPLVNGPILLVGGFRRGASLRSAELVDPATGAVTLTAPLAELRWIDGGGNAAGVALQDGRALILGGMSVDANGELIPLATAEVFVP